MSSGLAVKAKTDVDKGMAYVCALCHKWMRARERGEKQCEAAQAGKSCGGPLVKMTFPEYEGPLEKAEWSNFCFRCGEPSAAGVQVPGEFKVMGICDSHLEMLEKMTPKNGGKPLRLEHVDAAKAELIVK